MRDLRTICPRTMIPICLLEAISNGLCKIKSPTNTCRMSRGGVAVNIEPKLAVEEIRQWLMERRAKEHQSIRGGPRTIPVSLQFCEKRFSTQYASGRSPNLTAELPGFHEACNNKDLGFRCRR